MYQESTDKLKGTVRSDTLLFVLLIVFFLFAGTIATVLKTKFDSNIPLYVLAIVVGGLMILIYRLRIVGWRYTVFYKEPEPEYDARFDDYITHEDYPYPVGTIVFERTSSAKGEIVEVVSCDEIVAFLEPGAEYSADEEVYYCPARAEKSRSLVFERGGKKVRIFFCPTDKFVGLVESILTDR